MSILVLRGLPGSGKSTWARELLAGQGNYKRVNRDCLRDMVDFGVWSESKEKYIRKAELALATLYLDAGFCVVVDDCNLSPSAMSMWQEFARAQKVDLEIKDFTDVPLEVCIERDLKRANSVGEREIRKMHWRYLYKPPSPPVYDQTLPDALIVDVDGTLALLHGRNPYDASTCESDLVNEHIVEIVERYFADLTLIILVSGRSEQHRPETIRWLEKHQIPYHRLLMRPEGDTRRDAIIKREIYDREIAGRYNVRFVLDDRDQVVHALEKLRPRLPTGC